MSDMTFRATTTGSAGTAERIGRTFSAIRDEITRRILSWQTRKALNSLSDAQLRDIGLTRSQIDAIAHGNTDDQRVRRHATA